MPAKRIFILALIISTYRNQSSISEDLCDAYQDIYTARYLYITVTRHGLQLSENGSSCEGCALGRYLSDKRTALAKSESVIIAPVNKRYTDHSLSPSRAQPARRGGNALQPCPPRSSSTHLARPLALCPVCRVCSATRWHRLNENDAF